MAKNAYYVYRADGDHEFLGRIAVAANVANDIDGLLRAARRKFDAPSIRIESRPRAYRPPLGKLRVQPMVDRRRG